MPTYLTGAVYDTAFNNAGDPVTLSFNAGSPTNGVIVVDVMWRDTAANTIAGVTFAGNALSGSSLVGSGVIGYRFKRAIGSSGGTQNVVIDPVAPFGTGEGAVTVLVRVYNDCDQTTPSDGFASATGSDTTLEGSVTSPDGDLAIFGGCIRSFGTDMTVTAGGGTRRLYNAVNGELSSAASDAAGSGGTATVTLTDNGAAGSWLLMGENLNAAAAGTTDGAFSSAGAGAASFTGASTAAGVAASSGAATAAFTGASTAQAALAASGAATVAFTGAATAASVLSSAGAATAQFTGAATAAGVFSSAGVATVAFSNNTITSGAFAAAGAGAASFVGSGIVAGAMSAAGVGAASFTGAATFAGAFASAGVGALAGTASSTAASVFTSAGLGLATFVGIDASGPEPEPSQTGDPFARSFRHTATARARTWTAPRRNQ